MKKYKHVFFDLDHTLWDFEKNASECLVQIYDDFSVGQSGQVPFDTFFQSFSVVNKAYWARLEAKEIDSEYLRKNRFRSALKNIGIEVDECAGLSMDEAFLKSLPNKKYLLDGAVNILELLKHDYELHILSNGWYDVQIQKMQSSGIDHYFKEVITNERAQARKPDREIFEFALNITNATLEESIMIGDNLEADIKGAIGAGMDTIFYNPERVNHDVSSRYEVNHLMEIESILL